jgi:hypothetical protein
MTHAPSAEEIAEVAANIQRLASSTLSSMRAMRAMREVLEVVMELETRRQDAEAGLAKAEAELQTIRTKRGLK